MIFTESLRNASLDALVAELSPFRVAFYSGTIPTLASDAITGTRLLTFDIGAGTGCTWQAASAGSVIRTTSAMIATTIGAGGTATYWRLYKVGDEADTSDTGLKRIQGTCSGNNPDAILDTTTIVTGQTYNLGNVKLDF